MNRRIAAAEARSAELLRQPPRLVPADGAPRARVYAMGDPQTSHARLLALLDDKGLLGDDGMLAPDVGLISIGDHFDFGAREGEPPRSPEEVGAEGTRNVRWLAEHPVDQVVLIAGNHDLARVQELAFESDATFAEARALGRQIALDASRGEDTAALEQRFRSRFEHLPTPGVAGRDYSAFRVAQRDLVEWLLLHERMVLGWAAPLGSGEEALLTHAGVTERELALLGAPVGAGAIAAALGRLLRERVERVAAAWRRGERARLDLGPVHEPGRSGQEGGGLCYHRPAALEAIDAGWARSGPAPRRFDPRELPLGLVQVAGHSGHSKCRRELGPWLMPSAETEPGPVRTLSVSSTEVRYEGLRLPPRPGEATLYLIDGAMNATPPPRYELLALAEIALR